MLSDTLRSWLQQGKAVSGCTISLNAPELVEILGMVGFDFVFIDAEHGPFSEMDVRNLITAADAVAYQV